VVNDAASMRGVVIGDREAVVGDHLEAMIRKLDVDVGLPSTAPVIWPA
jgi:hypothetical protein